MGKKGAFLNKVNQGSKLSKRELSWEERSNKVCLEGLFRLYKGFGMIQNSPTTHSLSLHPTTHPPHSYQSRFTHLDPKHFKNQLITHATWFKHKHTHTHTKTTNHNLINN